MVLNGRLQFYYYRAWMAGRYQVLFLWVLVLNKSSWHARPCQTLRLIYNTTVVLIVYRQKTLLMPFPQESCHLYTKWHTDFSSALLMAAWTKPFMKIFCRHKAPGQCVLKYFFFCWHMGSAGFEPTISCSQNRHDTRLHHDPEFKMTIELKQFGSWKHMPH